MHPQPSTPDSVPADPASPQARAPRQPPAEADQHPADPAHDLSDSPVHARSPDAYTEEPGSHRRGPDGPALDVGA